MRLRRHLLEAGWALTGKEQHFLTEGSTENTRYPMLLATTRAAEFKTAIFGLRSISMGQRVR
jgi:hypothetical protein